jgi:hypothetical protein
MVLVLRNVLGLFWFGFDFFIALSSSLGEVSDWTTRDFTT